MTDEKRSSNIGFKVIVVALLLAIACGVGYFALDRYKETKEKSEVINESGYTLGMTVEDRMEMWNAEKANVQDYELFLALPPVIFQAILEEIGPGATIGKIVNEYRMNIAKYIQIQIADQLPDIDITGPDGKTVEKAEISVKLKEPEIPDATIIRAEPAKTPTDTI